MKTKTKVKLDIPVLQILLVIWVVYYIFKEDKAGAMEMSLHVPNWVTVVLILTASVYFILSAVEIAMKLIRKNKDADKVG